MTDLQDTTTSGPLGISESSFGNGSDGNDDSQPNAVNGRTSCEIVGSHCEQCIQHGYHVCCICLIRLCSNMGDCQKCEKDGHLWGRT